MSEFKYREPDYFDRREVYVFKTWREFKSKVHHEKGYWWTDEGLNYKTTTVPCYSELQENKMKIWLHYMVRQVVLNNTILEFDIDVKGVSSDATMYPALGVKTVKVSYHKPLSFDEFCANDDDRSSSSLIGYYLRFREEIFKD